MSRVVKRVYRITSDPVTQTEQFKAELERVLNQLMEEDTSSDADLEEKVINIYKTYTGDTTYVSTSVDLDAEIDVTDSRSMGVVYQNKSGTIIDVRVSVGIK